MADLIEEIRALVEQATPRMMNPQQCADFLHVSTSLLYHWRAERRGPPFLQVSPKVVLYDREDVIVWAQSYKVETVCET